MYRSVGGDTRGHRCLRKPPARCEECHRFLDAEPSQAHGKNGSLSLLNRRRHHRCDGSSPIDLALSNGNRYLYSLDSGSGTITAFRVASDGSLEALARVSGIPAGANGLAAR